MKKTGRKRPKVTLIVETSFASGRNIVRGVVRYARRHGPWLMHHEWRNTDLFFPPWLKRWEGDGIIARIENPRMAKALLALGAPVVDLLGAMRLPKVPLVHVDDAAIARAAAAHLLERGFRHFAFCGLRDFPWSVNRRQAFVDTLAREGFACAVNEWTPRRRAPWSWEREQNQMTDWLLRLPRPLGIMLCNDLHGHFVLEACRRGGIAVPDEAAIVGVDNDESVCDVCDPPLSSVVPDDERVGEEAARLLDALMHGRAWDGRPIIVPPLGVHTRLSSDTMAVPDAHVAAAVGYIRENACHGIRVGDVARAAPLSRSLLQRRFRAALGRSIHEEILRVRIEHARFLLEESEMPLAEVADRSGFRHQAYLGDVFRRHLGQTPLTYRRQHRVS